MWHLCGLCSPSLHRHTLSCAPSAEQKNKQTRQSAFLLRCAGGCPFLIRTGGERKCLGNHLPGIFSSLDKQRGGYQQKQGCLSVFWLGRNQNKTIQKPVGYQGWPNKTKLSNCVVVETLKRNQKQTKKRTKKPNRNQNETKKNQKTK